MDQYQIVSGRGDPQVFAKLVNDEMSNGWVPLGGVTTLDGGLLQAMTKPSPTEEQIIERQNEDVANQVVRIIFDHREGERFKHLDVTSQYLADVLDLVAKQTGLDRNADRFRAIKAFAIELGRARLKKVSARVPSS